MAEKNARLREKRSQFEDGFRVLQGKKEFVTYPEDASLRVWYSDEAWRYDMHEHSAAEVVLTLEGCVDYELQDQVYHVEKGQILFIPMDTMHALHMGENSSRLLFLFEPEPLLEMRDIKRVKTHFDRCFYLRDESETHVRIRDLLYHTAECYRQQEPLWNTLCFSDLLQIYALLGQKYLGDMFHSLQTNDPPFMASEVISSAINYINGHFREDVTLEDVAGFAGFSRFYFSRSFKQQTGYSFRDFLGQRRIQAAMELLIRTNKPISQVAEESGFGSIATFNRVFREYKNCTPSQYRAIYGKY